MSKAALVRRYVGDRLRPLHAFEQDPLRGFCGIAGDAEPVDDIDEFRYGPSTRAR